uniref:Uncharacterized protein n=1 Tax=Oryza glumipatula TaxID=40148 RepID=A0A0D9Y5U5_9ORYZ
MWGYAIPQAGARALAEIGGRDGAGRVNRCRGPNRLELGSGRQQPVEWGWRHRERGVAALISAERVGEESGDVGDAVPQVGARAWGGVCFIIYACIAFQALKYAGIH